MKVPLPEFARPSDSTEFYVVDGRHRLAGGGYHGLKEFRCDLISRSGHALRVLPIDKLAVDPHVQFEFSYDNTRALRYSAQWDDRKVGVLTVCPVNGPESLTIAERADLKRGLDQDRRTVARVESFLAGVQACDERSVKILEICRKNGYKIGKLRGGKPFDTVQAVGVLEAIVERQGLDALDSTLAFATTWLGDAKANTRFWIEALSLFVRDGYVDQISSSGWQKLREAVPAVELRRAQGEAVTTGGGAPTGYTDIAYVLATRLRKRAGLRQRPAITRGGGRARPI